MLSEGDRMSRVRSLQPIPARRLRASQTVGSPDARPEVGVSVLPSGRLFAARRGAEPPSSAVIFPPTAAAAPSIGQLP